MTKSKRTDRQQREWKQLALEFEWLYDAALGFLAEHDPIGIVFHPAEYTAEHDPIDIAFHPAEYTAVLRTILPRLDEAATVEDLTRMLHEEFVRWFSPRIAGPPSRYRPIAEDLWAAYLRWRNTRG